MKETKLKKKINIRRSIAKLNKDTGRGYVSSQGIARPEKQIKRPCGPECSRKCIDLVSADQRLKLFNTFYGLGHVNLQWQYIAQHINRNFPIQRRRTRQHGKPKYEIVPRKPRRPNIRYYLDADNGRVQVCRKMFKSTLDVSHANILTAIRKTNDNGDLIEADRRGGVRK